MVWTILFYIGIVVAILILWGIATRIIRRFWKFLAPAFFGIFLDSRLRKKLQPAEKIVERSGIKKGMIVMELGCGSGTFTIDAARAVRENGKVFAVDIQQKMINMLLKKLQKPENKYINNIETKVASAYELPFADKFFDLVYMVTVLPEIPDKQRALKEIYRVLKNNGILAVSEFFPDPDYPLRKTTKKWCEKAGFKLIASKGNFFNYTLRFKKAK